MTARGVIGALVAVSAGLPFFPLWATLAVGAGAGLLVPLIQYAIDHLLRLEDATSAVATHGLSALWGLLAVGLIAGGRAGAGWNGVGEGVYLGVEGQGVSGYLVASGLASDWPGQFQAQAFGVAAIACVVLLASGLLMGLARGLVRAWYGEVALQRVVRPSRAGWRRPQAKRGRRARGRRAKVKWNELLRRGKAWLPDGFLKRQPRPDAESVDVERDGLAERLPHEPASADDGLEPSDLPEDVPVADDARAERTEELDEGER
jgi:hypothetical protein